MGPLTLRGKSLPLAFAIAASTISATYGQTGSSSASCSVSAVPTQVRAEGLTERLGDITLQCSSPPGAVLAGSLTIYIPVSVTNRVNASNQAVDASLYVDYGSGFMQSGIPGVVSGGSITFYNYSFTTPASGNVNLKVSGVRGGGFSPSQQVAASVSASGLQLNQSQVTVAYPQTGLFATLYSTGIACTGSPLPSAVTMANLFGTGTAFFSTRLTEGFGSASLVRGTGDDNGTRFLVKYSGFPSNAQLYVPQYVAGSDAATPTAGGDLGLAQSPGQYVPGSGTLLLALVQNADATGAGGSALPPPTGSGAVPLNLVSAVPLTNGSGYAVYEVVDANNTTLESAQFPTFIGLSNVTTASVANESVSFAPVSSTPTASQTAPVPRFLTTVPGTDCNIIGDCQANYFPKLSVVTSPSIQLTAPAGGTTNLAGYLPVGNKGGGIMNWTATVTYGSGSGWLLLSTTSGVNSGSIMINANAAALTAGTYNANILIDAGPMAGSFTEPVVLTVTAPATPTGTPGGTSGGTPTGTSGGTPDTPAITVSGVVNAATFAQTPVVSGSLATVMGSNLSGKNVSVTFDGSPASLLYTSSTQINLQVPAGLGVKTSTSMVVTVDGNSGAPVSVPLAPAWPSIFTPGVLNQDNTVNATVTPAKAGTAIQIYATGIPDGATVWASIGGPGQIAPLYAGPAPGIAGMQQVNVMVPAGVSGPAVPLYVCAIASGQQYCSNTFNLAVQ